MSTRKPKSVSFFTSNEEDVKILKFIQNIDNFSSYVKDLIKADMQRREQPLKILKKTEGEALKS
nr:hypothetical protein [Fredinandcohnia onubensis]